MALKLLKSQFQFDHFGSTGYCLAVNFILLLSKALLLSGAAVGF